MRSSDRIALSNSPGLAKNRWCTSHCLLVASFADSLRVMAAIKEHSAGRDRSWRRNYSCWIRAPERVDIPGIAVKSRATRRSHESNGKALARAI